MMYYILYIINHQPTHQPILAIHFVSPSPTAIYPSQQPSFVPTTATTMASSVAPIVLEDDEIEPAGENQVINEVRLSTDSP